MRRYGLLAAITFSGAASGAGLAPAVASPLETPACVELETRLDALRNAGAAADMARGPEWARANLPLERLQRIAALIEVEEQLSFRCGLAKVQINLPTTVEGGEEEVPGPGEAVVEGTTRTIALPQRAPPAPPSTSRRPAAAKAPVPRPAAPKQADKSKAAPKTRPRAPRESAPESPAPRKAPAKKMQPQADDAYRPPRPMTSERSWAPVIRQ